MENFKAINYHETRDFSRKMNATFEFIRQNFRSLGKAILFIAGPPVLLASLLMSSFFQDFFTAAFNAGRGSQDMFEMFTTSTFWFQIILMMLFLVVSTVATISTINNYIILYEEKQTNKIEVGEVWERVRDTFWMYLRTAIQLSILLIIFYTVFIIFIALIGSGSAIAGFGIFISFLVMIYSIFGSSLVFIIRAYEKIGFFESLIRSFKLVYGKWWSTFGLIFVLYFIVMLMSYVFMIPWYVLTMVTALHEAGVTEVGTSGPAVGVVATILLTFYYLAQMLMYAMPNIGIAFQYFNLVERKESRGLMNQINSLGQTPQPPAATSDETY
jgi:hypothetical protein